MLGLQGRFVVVILVLTIASSVHGEPPDIIDLATESAGIEIYGASTYDFAGSSVAVGDIDGDDAQDLVVAACDAIGLTGVRSGIFYIVWDVASFSQLHLDLATAPPGAVSRIYAPPNGDPLNCAVHLGDFNDDGFADIMIGEPGVPSSWAGRIYVLFGSDSFPSSIDLAAPPLGTVRVNGHVSQGLLGMGLCACDFNGDGYDEIVAAAPGMTRSEVYVLEGGTQFQAVYSTALVEPRMTRIVDSEIDRSSGRAMACADVNFDGRDDLLIGSPGKNLATTYDGRAVLLYGLSSLPDTLHLGDASVLKKTIRPEYTHGQLGNAVAFGDVDGGGAIDAVISAYQGDPLGCTNCGEVYVLHQVDLMPDLIEIGNAALSIARLRGNPARRWFGIGLTVADVDRNGRDEIVAADLPSSSAERSAAFIVHGQPTLPSVVEMATYSNMTTIWDRTPDSQMGRNIVSSDVNADTIDDLIFGARYADPAGRADAGAVYLMLGDTTTPVASTPPLSWVSDAFPNPFSSTVDVYYDLARSTDVRIEIHDVAGRRVASFERRGQASGRHRFSWNGATSNRAPIPSGIYFLRITTGGLEQSRKLVLLR